MPRPDPETELTQLPGDRVDQEIRDAETLPQENRSELVRVNPKLGVTDWGKDEEG